MGKKTLIALGCWVLLLPASVLHARKALTRQEVQVVRNPKKPTAPEELPAKLILEEETTFGGGENPEESFSEAGSFAVDDEGRVYVPDIKEGTVKVFDRDAGFLFSIGKKGQGPGEMNLPAGVLITSEGELLVEDAMNRRLAFFTMNGKFLRNVSLADKMSLINLVIDTRGNLLGRELTVEGSKLFWEIKKYDPQLKPLFSLSRVEFPNPLEGKINPFSLLVAYAMDGKDQIYVGDPSAYEIRVYSPEGRHLRTIAKKYDPVKVTKKDIEEALERMPDMGFNIKERLEFPKTFPGFASFTLDEAQRLIVRTFEKGEREGEYFLDIFDPEGRYIARALHKGEPRLWKDGKMYSLDENDEGYRVIKTYRAIWK